MKRKSGGRLFSILLGLALALGTCPTAGLAEEATGGMPEEEEDPAIVELLEDDIAEESLSEDAKAGNNLSELSIQGSNAAGIGIESVGSDIAPEAVGVIYLDAEGKTQTCTNYTVVESGNGQQLWGKTGEMTWYVVNGDVTISNGAVVTQGDVRLILCDGATLTVINMTNGIWVQDQLTIYGQGSGTGELKTNASDCGIKADTTGGVKGDITINGGKVDVSGSEYGIFYQNTNKNDNGAELTINGGTVIADSTKFGIDYDTVTINGGEVTAKASAERGYAISAKSLAIKGGQVTASVSGAAGNGINSVTDLTIENGKVTATATAQNARGIQTGGNMTINGGVVIASSEQSSGIYVSGHTLTVNDGTVTATGTSGISANEGNVAINGGTVTASSNSSGAYACGIYANNYSAGKAEVSINGGTVTATGGDGGSSGIFVVSAAFYKTGSTGEANVTISGGTVNATGNGENGSGIRISGNNNDQGSTNVLINGGAVTATCTGAGGVGIRAAASHGKAYVTINGDKVTAIGGTGAIGGTVKNSIKGTGWTNTEGTAGKAAIAINNEGQTLSDYKKAQFPGLPEAKAVAPTAKNLAYTGEAQELVDEGSTSEGTLYYALGENGTDVPEFDGTSDSADKKWATSVPAGTDTGTYYVWYKVVGDENHSDTEPACVTSTISVVYTVTFDANGHGTAPAAQDVNEGKAAAKPADPTASGYVFGGWFSDKACTKAYDFSAKVTADLTLYAKWAEESKPTPTPAPTTDPADEPEPTPEPANEPAAEPAKLAKASLSTVAYPAKGTIKAKWKAVKGAKKYQLQWRKAGAKKWSSKTVKGTSLTVKGLKKGSLYELRVRAVKGSQKGAWSKVVRRWLKGVSGIKAKAAKKGAVKATWKADKSANAGYRIFVRYKKDGAVVAKKTVKAGSTSVTIKGLKGGKKAYVQVRPLRKYKGNTYIGALHYANSAVKVK